MDWELLIRRIKYFFPVVLLLLYLFRAYYIGSNKERSPFIRIIITLGIYIIPLVIIAITLYLIDEYSYSKNGYNSSGAIIGALFSIVFLSLFIFGYNTNGRSEDATTVLWIIALLTGIILLFIILVSAGIPSI